MLGTLYLTFTLFWGLCCGFVLLSSAAGAGELPISELFPTSSSWTYQWVSEVLLNEKGAQENRVGFSIRAELLVESVWEDEEKLLRIQIISPKLWIKSRKAPEPEGFVSHTSQLDSSTNHPFYVLWNRGKIDHIFLAKDEPLSLANLKKGIASLLQLTTKETVETDASGKCRVSYQTLTTNQVQKTKSDCISADMDFLKNPNPILATQVFSNRQILYKLDPESKSILEASSHEDHEMFLAVNEDVGNKVQAEQTLKLTKSEPSKSDKLLLSGNLQEVLKSLDKNGVVYTKQSLVTEQEPDSAKDSTFTSAVQDQGDQLKANLLGTLAPAKAFLRLVFVARRATEEDVAKALGVKKNQKILHQIYDVLGYAQTFATHEAVMKKLHFDKKDHEELSERYLWALSMCSHPNPEVISDLLNRFKKNPNFSEKVRETLLHTSAAMVYRLKKLPKEKRNVKVEEAVEEAILNNLEASKGEDRHLFLRALKNLRSETTIDSLLVVTKKGSPKEEVLAWKALRALEPVMWNQELLKSARRTFFQLDKKHDSSSRTLAMDILLQSSPSDELLASVFQFLNSNCRSYEVKQYVYQTLKMMMDSCEKFRKRIVAIVGGNKELNNYSVLALKGLSTALKRSFVEHKSSNGSLLTMQEMFGGIVKRGVVNVVMSKEGISQDVFSLGIFSGGLSSFLSSEGEEGSEESATAGMELTMLGTHVRPFVFFNSQGELMGHVWSGTASEKTSAYKALAMLQDHKEFLRLGSGFVAELTDNGATSFDLSGKIEFSLWNRNAQSLVEKAAGIFIVGTINVDTSFVKSKVEYNLSIEPKLQLQADIDFYSDINLCMRLVQPDSIFKHNVYKIERIPNSKHRLRKVKYKKFVVPGKTYSLNKKNSDMCNAIFKSS